jgi:nitroimidazol reductase NimA-like FMN-containing flavoprotein (pyridoxamine 5'-phosphate oxidase superfamily)
MTASLPPTAEAMTLPDGYGQSAKALLSWADVAQRLAQAPRYWLATVRPDGRPHVVPTDGLWIDDVLWFGGSTGTVHHRNLSRNGAAAVHLEDGTRAIIVEGQAALTTPSSEQARGLAALSTVKYGFAAPIEAYRATMWRLSPARVLAWTDFPHDATRFTFGPHEPHGA